MDVCGVGEFSGFFKAKLYRLYQKENSEAKKTLS